MDVLVDTGPCSAGDDMKGPLMMLALAVSDAVRETLPPVDSGCPGS